MKNKEAIEKVAELCGISSFELEMFISSYKKYKEVRFGPIRLHGGSLSDFKEYVKEQRDLSHAIDGGATRQYDNLLELIEVYEVEELEE